MINEKYGKWMDNVFVSFKKDIFTVLPDGTLEIRGKSWTKWKKGDHPGTDRVRRCRLANEQQARNVVEIIAKLDWDDYKKGKKK